MDASTECLQSLDVVYRCAVRFVTGCRRLTHHCVLYAKSGHLWACAELCIGWILFTKLFLVWFLLIYAYISKKLIAIMVCILAMFFICLFLVYKLSWGKGPLVLLPPLQGTHSRRTWNCQSLFHFAFGSIITDRQHETIWDIRVFLKYLCSQLLLFIF